MSSRDGLHQTEFEAEQLRERIASKRRFRQIQRSFASGAGLFLGVAIAVLALLAAVNWLLSLTSR